MSKAPLPIHIVSELFNGLVEAGTVDDIVKRAIGSPAASASAVYPASSIKRRRRSKAEICEMQ